VKISEFSGKALLRTKVKQFYEIQDTNCSLYDTAHINIDMDDKTYRNRTMAGMKEQHYLDWVYEKERIDWIEILLNAFILVMGIITSYFLLLKIFDHSPVFEVITAAIATIIAGGIIYMYKEFGKLNEFIKTAKNSFKNAREDAKEMKTEVKELRKELTNFKISTNDNFGGIKTDFKILKSEVSMINSGLKSIKSELSRTKDKV
jgi:hypothetical protein